MIAENGEKTFANVALRKSYFLFTDRNALTLRSLGDPHRNASGRQHFSKQFFNL